MPAIHPRDTAIHALWQRIKPYAVLYFATETLLRVVLAVKAWGQIRTDVSWLPYNLLSGVVLDAGVWCYFMPLLMLVWLGMPKARQGQRGDRIVSAVLFGLFTYVMLFTSIAEWFFWDEFSARFNFIAVDYLVYTQEVIGNIMQSYPIIPLLAGIGALSAGAGWLFYRKQQQPVVAQAPWTLRLAALGGSLLLAGASFMTVGSAWTSASGNRFLTEIGKNGIFELFSAYRNNTLDYDRFYVTRPKMMVRNDLRRELAPTGTTWLDDGVARAMGAGDAAPERHSNVVMITVESLSADFMRAFGETRNLTPNLDALIGKSLFFDNLYATGTRTVYGLSALSLSLPPLPGNAIVRRPHNENLFTLGSVLNSKGYVSTFLYGGHGYFDNMNYFFGHNGYRIIDRTDLQPNEITAENIWGVADEDIFNRTLKENDRLHAAGKPFFDMIMTTSNHRPYTYPEGRIDIPSKTGRAGAVKYTDYAIGKFLKDAERKPWFANTIFVIVADHTAGSARKSELDPDGYHIPLFIYAPHLIAPQRVTTMASQIDVAPTVLGLMNMRYDSRFFGQDILRQPPERAFISNYQQVALLTPHGLAVLKPVKQALTYHRAPDRTLVPDRQADQALIDRAVTFFQGASSWQTWSHALSGDRP